MGGEKGGKSRGAPSRGGTGGRGVLSVLVILEMNKTIVSPTAAQIVSFLPYPTILYVPEWFSSMLS